MSIEWRLGWLHFLARDARKCNKRCLDSSKEGILCIALWDLPRQIATALPMSLIIFFDFSLNGL